LLKGFLEKKHLYSSTNQWEKDIYAKFSKETVGATKSFQKHDSLDHYPAVKCENNMEKPWFMTENELNMVGCN
jgi:hypothetical protein